jgi:hypothetical protein
VAKPPVVSEAAPQHRKVVALKKNVIAAPAERLRIYGVELFRHSNVGSCVAVLLFPVAATALRHLSGFAVVEPEVLIQVEELP